MDVEWQNVKHKKNKKQNMNKMTNVVVDKQEQTLNNQEHINLSLLSDEERGINKKFTSKWKVYTHKTFCDKDDWKINSYDCNFFIIDSISTFHTFFNNFHKLNTTEYSFYIMRSIDTDNQQNTFIEPIWEHESNKKGGYCSTRLSIDNGNTMFQQLCILVMNNSLGKYNQIINGISYSIKTVWSYIKIWTSEHVQDEKAFLPTSVTGQYNNLTIKYTPNKPEY